MAVMENKIIDRISRMNGLSDKDAITMILSSCADFGSESGALLSVSKFDDAALKIIGYVNRNVVEKENT